MNTKEPIIWVIISRSLVFPGFTAIAFIGAMILFFKWVVNFIRFGGEAIAYTDKTTRKTIFDIYQKLHQTEEKP